jgi:hypothetical protein
LSAAAFGEAAAGILRQKRFCGEELQRAEKAGLSMQAPVFPAGFLRNAVAFGR